MPTLTLHIRHTRPNKNGECAILLKYAHNGQSIHFKTGRAICPLQFDSKATDNWITSDYGESKTTFNILLKKLKNEAEDKMNRFYIQNNRYPTCGEMKLLLNSKTEQAKSFFTLFDEFMHSRRHEVTTGTYRNYMKFKERLTAYQTYNGQPFTFQSINHSFYGHFTSYLSKQYGNQGNTIGSYIRILKTFLNWAHIHHSIQIDKVVMAGMKVTSEQNFYVWLSLDEIETIYQLKGLNEIQERSRNIFVFQCFAGCRYGDLQNVMKENIVLDNGAYFLQIKTRKNQKLIKVPLAKKAVAILEKYKGRNVSDWLPTMQECNRHIKEVCKLAGMLETVQIVRGSGDNRKEIRFQKWQLITTHSARRSAVNNLKSAGIPDHVISSITGQAIQTIQGYKHADTSDVLKAITVFDRPAPMSAEPRERN